MHPVIAYGVLNGFIYSSKRMADGGQHRSMQVHPRYRHARRCAGVARLVRMLKGMLGNRCKNE